jgi:uncharacterized protein (AIM24 family)
MATYTAQKEADITLAASLPGEIRPVEISPAQEYIAQKGAFLCATQGVTLSAVVSGVKSGLFGGEGFVLQRLSGQGLVFLELDGAIQEIDLRRARRSSSTPETWRSLRRRWATARRWSRALRTSSSAARDFSSRR